MKNCDVRKLQLYLDGELSEVLCGPLETHLCACPACRGELAGLRQLSGLLGNFPAIPPSPAIRLAAESRSAKNCSQIAPLINAFLEGTLTGARREGAALHFALCRQCREELAAQRQVRSLMVALPEETPPEKIRRTVQEALRQRRRARLAPPSPWPRIRRVATAAALAVVAVALVWGFPNLSVNNRPETAAISPDQNEKPAPTENRVAEIAPNQPEVPVAETPPTPRERVAFIPIRSRNLTYRHVSLPGRVVEISNPVEMAALPEPEGESHNAYSAPAVGATPADPVAIAAARQDLLRASEQYEVLQKETVLSHLPGPEHLINTPINDNKKPMKEPDVSKFGPGKFV